MFKYELATLLTLNIEKYCYSYLNGLADLWCLRGRCLPITVDFVCLLFRSLYLLFSSHEHKVRKVSYCYGSLSVVHRPCVRASVRQQFL